VGKRKPGRPRRRGLDGLMFQDTASSIIAVGGDDDGDDNDHAIMR
jgi:hypothetical protein